MSGHQPNCGQSNNGSPNFISQPASNKKSSDEDDCLAKFCCMLVLIAVIGLVGFLYDNWNRNHSKVVISTEKEIVQSCALDNETLTSLAAQTKNALTNLPNGTHGRMIWSRTGGGCIDGLIINGVNNPYIRRASECNNTLSTLFSMDSEGGLIQLSTINEEPDKNCSNLLPGTDLCINPIFLTPIINRCQPDLLRNRVYFSLVTTKKWSDFCVGLEADDFFMRQKRYPLYWLTTWFCLDAEFQHFYLDDIQYDYDYKKIYWRKID